MTPVLNRTTGPQILRLFDVCFKQGVIDAFNFGNDLDAKEFLEEKQEERMLPLAGSLSCSLYTGGQGRTNLHRSPIISYSKSKG